ncbi:dipeptidase [Nocardia sp. XZ_19_385]|uniref:dipeptidase n=1 Tax=Nocardia sp. XZ_19_385 TaxID=2769488 RepID=UPI0018900BAD|nr:membrane dipeptidase [Nocardia sp. XZ_19_385]
MPPFVWEQHCCLPLLPSASIAEAARYPVGSYVSLNVGYAPESTADAVAMAELFRKDALDDGRFRLVQRYSDIAECAGELIALAFDLEDSGPLGGNLDNIEMFHELGVRSLATTYNHANAAGCGCLDTEDTGLTAYGRDVVRTLNEVGMFVDGSHCSRRSGLDMAELTAAPMIYSHSNFAALWAHPRNITDEQALACARTGGVIGINGVGIFLGHNAESERAERVAAMARHIEYGAELVGIEHVGVGSDYSFDHDEFNRAIAENPENFSEEYTKYGPLQWTPPEDWLGNAEVPGLDEVLADRGFSESDIAAVFGGNFSRIAKEVFRD